MGKWNRDDLTSSDYRINIFFLFLARPSAPRELKVLDIIRNTVQLSWEPPEDDGGSPVTGYIIEKREVSRKTWIKVSSFFLTSASVCYIVSTHATEFYVILLWLFFGNKFQKHSGFFLLFRLWIRSLTKNSLFLISSKEKNIYLEFLHAINVAQENLHILMNL